MVTTELKKLSIEEFRTIGAKVIAGKTLGESEQAIIDAYGFPTFNCWSAHCWMYEFLADAAIEGKDITEDYNNYLFEREHYLFRTATNPKPSDTTLELNKCLALYAEGKAFEAIEFFHSRHEEPYRKVEQDVLDWISR